MKKLMFVTIFAMLCSATGARTVELPQSPADPRMKPEERAKVIKMLEDSQAEYLGALDKLTDAQWNYKPSPFKWSVGEVAEHIALTEVALFAAVERALAEKPNPDWEKKTAGKDAFIERVMPNRQGRAQAPIEVRPTGKLTREEVIKRFKDHRVKVMEFTRQTDLPLKAHTLDHPFPVFSTLNAYDWLIYVPLHTIRHNKQIAEVKASAGYPK
jgi:DinB family protein